MKQKSEKIIDALGNIDDNYVLECVPLLFARPRRRRTPWLLVAACIVLCILAAPKAWTFVSEYMQPNPITEDIPLDSTETPDLPLLTLGTVYHENRFSYYGAFEEELANSGSVADLERIPETLPVYEAIAQTEETMEEILRNAAAYLGLGDEIEWHADYAEIGSTDIYALMYWDGRLRIAPYTRSELFTLPEGCGDDTIEGARAAAEYLLENYGDLLGMVQPEVLIQGNSEIRYTPFTPRYEVIIYDAAGDTAEELLQYSCSSITFRILDETVTFVEIAYHMLGEKYGDYPILTSQEAETLFLQGYGVGESDLQAPEIARVDLLYPVWEGAEQYVPYYRFLVKKPMSQEDMEYSGECWYEAYYIPAVCPEYVADMPSYWMSVEWIDKAETLAYNMIYEASDPEGIRMDAETRDDVEAAFRSYLRINPEQAVAYGGKGWSWNLYNSTADGDQVAVLECVGPQADGESEVVAFLYYYQDGTVEFGLPDLESPYAAILDQYDMALQHQWDKSAYYEAGLSPLSTYCYEGNALDNVGFAFLDVDGDGSDELLIGAISSDEFLDKMVFELYTLENGAPVQVFAGWERNRYYLCAGEAGGYVIANERSGGAFNSTWYSCTLEGSSLTVAQVVVFDSVTDPQNPWYLAEDTDWDTSNDTPVGEDQARAVLDSLEAQRIQVEYTAFASYPN